jgi:hypothetical protein
MTRSIRHLLLAPVFAVAAACGADYKDGTLTVPITIKEATINNLLNDKEVKLTDEKHEQSVLLDSITALNFREPNIVRVLGVRHRGTERSSGSFDLAFRAENKALVVAVTDVQIPGLSLDSPEVKHLNAKLTQKLGAEADKERKGGITEARVRGRTIELTLSVPIH